RYGVFEHAIAHPAGRQVAVLRRVPEGVRARLQGQASGPPTVLAVDVQALVGPVAREPLARTEADVDLVALRVAIFIEEGLAAPAGGAVVFLHGGVPAVGMSRPPTPGVVEGTAGQQVGAAPPAH